MASKALVLAGLFLVVAVAICEARGGRGGGRGGRRGGRRDTFPMAAGDCAVDYACKGCAEDKVAVYNSTVTRNVCTWKRSGWGWKRSCTERTEYVVRKYCCPMCLTKPAPTYKNNTSDVVKYSCKPQCWMGEECKGCPRATVTNNFGHKSCCPNCAQSTTSFFEWGRRDACVCNANLPVNATIPVPDWHKRGKGDDSRERY